MCDSEQVLFWRTSQLFPNKSIYSKTAPDSSEYVACYDQHHLIVTTPIKRNICLTYAYLQE